MVGWLRWTEERWLFPRLEQTQCWGVPLISAALPPGQPAWRLRQGARALARVGCRRVVTAPGMDLPALPEALSQYGLSLVDPLPLCRAKGAELALALLDGVPLRRRCALLCGEGADGTARAIADGLCPQVGTLLLDFDRGQEELENHLRRRYGAPPGGEGEAQVTVALSPGKPAAGAVLRLWGRPDLGGLKLTCPWELPREAAELPFLTLLWETGRLTTGEIGVGARRNDLDRRGENTYNT